MDVHQCCGLRVFRLWSSRVAGMNPFMKLFHVAVGGVMSLSLLAGCGTTRHLTYSVEPLPVQPSPADLAQADAYRDLLPEALWLAPSQISVEAAPGKSVVTVTEINDASTQRTIASKITTINADNPLKPIWIEFQ